MVGVPPDRLHGQSRESPMDNLLLSHAFVKIQEQRYPKKAKSWISQEIVSP